MGQQLKPSVDFPNLDWTEFKKDHLNNNTIYKSNTGLLAQKRQLLQDKLLNSEQELKIYLQRYTNTLPLVKVYAAQVIEEKRSFCSTTQKLIVFVEYIPNRLQKIKPYTLSQEQCLFVLQQSLKAFHELFLKFGYFQIKPYMIGFNSEGKVRCWLNSDFASNRIENIQHSVLTGYQHSPNTNSHNIIDPRLRQTLQRSMVSDLWNIVKKKSNIKNSGLFQRLSGLENTTFYNGKKLIELLISKYQLKLPESLLFENCLSLRNNIMNNQYSYGRVYDSMNRKMKVVEVVENQVLRSGTFNFHYEENDANFKDFNAYRDYVDNLQTKNQNKSHVSISFDKNLHFNKDLNLYAYKSPQRSVIKETLNSPRRTLKIIDKTVDISITQNLRSPTSNKTISTETEPSEKRIQSNQNLLLPLNTMKRQTSLLIPNLISERTILAELQQSNLPSPRMNVQPSQLRSPVKQKINYPYENQQTIFVNNYTPVLKRTSSRLIPPPPVFGMVRKQSSTNVINSNECRSPRIVKENLN